MERKKLIGYDLDGTLADTRRDIILGVQFMLKQMQKPDLSARQIELYVGEGLNQLVAKSLGEEDLKIVEQGARYLRDYYKKHLLDYTELYPSAQQTLEHFKDRIQVVVTNKPEPFTTQILTKLDVMPYLSGVYTGDKGIPRKPDPTVFFHLMKKHQVRAEEILWVGDSVIDFQVGKKAGIETVLLRHGFTSHLSLDDLGADYVLDDFEALLKLACEKKW